jgi:hypothetical protein
MEILLAESGFSLKAMRFYLPMIRNAYQSAHICVNAHASGLD